MGHRRIIKVFFNLKTQVNFGSNYIAQSERFFRNALKFDPERFERHDNGTERIHPFSLLQFGHGARSCIGRRTAEQEIYLTLIKVKIFADFLFGFGLIVLIIFSFHLK